MGIKPKRIAELVKRVNDRRRAEGAREERSGGDGDLAALYAAADAYTKATGNQVSIKIKQPKKKGRK